MQAVARTVWLVAAAKDIKLTYCHISGVNNVKADILSRGAPGGQCRGTIVIQIFLYNCRYTHRGTSESSLSKSGSSAAS